VINPHFGERPTRNEIIIDHFACTRSGSRDERKEYGSTKYLRSRYAEIHSLLKVLFLHNNTTSNITQQRIMDHTVNVTMNITQVAQMKKDECQIITKINNYQDLRSSYSISFGAECGRFSANARIFFSIKYTLI